jgi:hypothetical protein
MPQYMPTEYRPQTRDIRHAFVRISAASAAILEHGGGGLRIPPLRVDPMSLSQHALAAPMTTSIVAPDDHAVVFRIRATRLRAPAAQLARRSGYANSRKPFRVAGARRLNAI